MKINEVSSKLEEIRESMKEGYTEREIAKEFPETQLYFTSGDEGRKYPLYNPMTSAEENFQENEVKYLLVRVTEHNMSVVDTAEIFPSALSKILTIPKLAEQYGAVLEFALYEAYGLTPFALRGTNFLNYSQFFSCDERVLFEMFLFKYKYWKKRKGVTRFYLSYETIYRELGIKESRARTIVHRFIELGILTRQVRTTVIDNRPRQVGYFSVVEHRVLQLLPKIYQTLEFDNGKSIETFFNEFFVIGDANSRMREGMAS